MKYVVYSLVFSWLLGGIPAMAEKVRPGSEPVKVVATFSVLADWTRQVGGYRVEVTSLVGLDRDAHVFHPAPKDIQTVTRADLLVMNGLGFEGWLNRVVEASNFEGRRIIASEGIDVIHVGDETYDHDNHDHEHKHGQVDPHAWHSLTAARQYIRNISQALQLVDPAHVELYQRNTEAYLQRLDDLEKNIRDQLSVIPLEKRKVVVPHNAFAYLAREFDIQIYSLQSLGTGARPSAAQMAEVIRKIKREGIRAIFSENIKNDRLIDQVAGETNIQLGGELISGALSKKAGESYLGMMEHNLGAIVRALK